MLEPITVLEQLPRLCVHVVVQIVTDDGSAETCALTAAVLAVVRRALARVAVTSRRPLCADCK